MRWMGCFRRLSRRGGVWGLLRGARPARPAGKSVLAGGTPVWTAADIRRSGIAIDDRGLSNRPDIAERVAALFCTVTVGGDLERVGGKLVHQRTDFLREVYRDDLARGDLDLIRDEIPRLPAGARHLTVEDRRAATGFALDDHPSHNTRVFDAARIEPPNVCDGHGMEFGARHWRSVDPTGIVAGRCRAVKSSRKPLQRRGRRLMAGRDQVHRRGRGQREALPAWPSPSAVRCPPSNATRHLPRCTQKMHDRPRGQRPVHRRASL
jgi:hypothetical protein